jgi:hypothetical protein
LTINESKKFLALVMNLDYTKSEDRRVYNNVMKAIDPPGT